MENEKKKNRDVRLKVEESNKKRQYTSNDKVEWKQRYLHKQVSVSRKLKKDVCFIKQDSASGPGWGRWWRPLFNSSVSYAHRSKENPGNRETPNWFRDL